MSEPRDDADRQLISAAREGDRGAFDRLVHRYKATLYRFVRRYVGTPEDAYDLLQETFVSAWLALPRFQSQRSFSTWLHAIALNKCRDHARRRTVRRRISALLLASGSALLRDPSNDPESTDLPDPLRQRRLDVAIAALPSRYKEPLLLTLVSGMTHQQAAQQLGLTTKAVEMRLRRAKRRLREALTERAEIGTPSEQPVR
ncbi:MAG TPA: RNA polymerase sigma factor [Solirubrobacteraceae bacterium]|nr:RNA polymerase sigma factor [Solirubrobacteraceae bacterium]